MGARLSKSQHRSRDSQMKNVYLNVSGWIPRELLPGTDPTLPALGPFLWERSTAPACTARN
jgi:hypothetical protein